MITKAIKDISSGDLTALVSNSVEEGRQLEFKRELPGSADSDKRELCADVSSFANTAGGYLLFGVDEEKGAASAIPGLQSIEPDETILRIEQILAAGIDPPIPGVACRPIPIDSGQNVIAVHIPRSWRSPHLVKHGVSFRMYARTSRGKQPLDSQEIRRVFESTGSVVEAIRRWRDDRVAKILADDTPVRLESGAKLVLHIVPMESLGDPIRISVADLNENPIPFQPLGVSGWDSRINLDGYVTRGGRGYPNPDSNDHSYCQVFRSGRIEAVFSDLVNESNGRHVIPAAWFEKSVLEATARYLKSLAELNVSYPIVVMMCFLEARGAVMGVKTHHIGRNFNTIDRDVVLLPDVVLESMPTDLPRALRPMLDAAWNACGIVQSLVYDEKGNWNGGNLSGVPMEVIE